MKISHKVNLLQLVSIVMMASVVAFGLAKLGQIGTELEEIAEGDLPLIESLTAVTVGQLEQGIAVQKALRAGGVADHGGSPVVKEMHAEFERLNGAIGEAIRQGEAQARHVLEKIEQKNEAQTEFEKVEAQLKVLEGQHQAYERHAQETFTLIESGQLAEAEQAVLKTNEEGKQLRHEVEALLKDVEQFTARSAVTAEEHEQAAMTGMITIAIISLVLGVAIGVWITRGIKRSLTSTNETIRRIAANNDLSLRLAEGKDELGEMGGNFNQMMGHMGHALNEVSTAATQLAAAAEELSAVTEQARNGVAQQRSETDQVATAMNEMTASMEEVARNASQVAAAVTEANGETLAGTRVVEQSVKAIASLAAEVQKASGVIQELASDSQNIGTVLDVIKAIAEQTNLLALNAAIEAARAGDQGRGFAVVADEVRTLAQRTQESTAQIQKTIETLQARADQAVAVMNSGQRMAEQGVNQAGEAGASLVSISAAVSTISDMTLQIASASEEQSAVSAEINRSIVTIHDAATEMSLGAEHTAKTSHDIAQLATELQTSVSRFKL